MAFNEDDLRRLKDNLCGREDNGFNKYSVRRIKSLVVRLEAAELICETVSSNLSCLDRLLYVSNGRDLLQAWRKAAGK